MNKLKFLAAVLTALVMVLGIYSCGKEESKSENTINSESEFDRQALLKEIEKKAGIVQIDNYSLTPIIGGPEHHDLCSGSYAQMCGVENYTTHKQIINYKNCDIEITYRLWICEMDGQRFVSFQIIDWRTLGSCQEFLSEFYELYYNLGLQELAMEYINAMYQFASLVIEDTFVNSLTNVTTTGCDKPILHSSFIAVNCYKICQVPVWEDYEEPFGLSYLIQSKCARSCCFRNKSWCIIDGQPEVVNQWYGGRACTRFTDPCPDTYARCFPACDRL